MRAGWAPDTPEDCDSLDLIAAGHSLVELLSEINVTWPRKIFIESTALFQLGPRLETVDSAELLGLQKVLKFELFVSEVSWREYLRERKREIQHSLRTIAQVRAELLKHRQPVVEIDSAEQKIQEYMDRLESDFREKAGELGMQILPVPSIDLNKLLDMSIECIPPFEEPETKTKEKGFRDSLIMFTILENIRGRSIDNSVLITGDKLLTKGCSRFLKSYSTSLFFTTDFKEAREHIYGRLAKALQESLRAESQRAKDMLMGYKSEIESKVGEIRELTEDDLGIGVYSNILAGRSAGESLDVEKVLSLRFDSVESAIWKDAEKQISRILFKLGCIAQVLAKTPFWHGIFRNKPTFTIGGDKQSKAAVSVPAEPFEREIPFELYGEAQFERDNGGWRLHNLRVDKSPPSNGRMEGTHEGRERFESR